MRGSGSTEHDRLQKRTDELKDEHAALDRSVTPFDQEDHDRHRANLKKHKEALVRHRRQPRDESAS